LGNLLAALVEYFIGRKIGDSSDFEHRRQKLPLWTGKFPADSVIFLIVARFLPGYGAKFISILSGIYRVRLWRYVWMTVLATAISTAIVAYAGFRILSLFK
jgi:membrane protein DedA with SNARE-associated domain